MVKSIVSIICVAVILLAGALYENDFITRQFKEFDAVLSTLYEKVEDKTAVEDDALAVQTNWIDKKKFLHAFIPHNEIREMELWIAESVTLIRDEKWEDASSKVTVMMELSEQIPKSFALSFENIL